MPYPNHQWVYLPEEEGEEPWIGQLSTPDRPGGRATFEILRHSEGLFDESVGALEKSEVLIALLDHQQLATIIGPFVSRIDPGSVGVGYAATRTRLEGSFQNLLIGLAVSDLDEKILKGVTIASDSFRLWYAPDFGVKVERKGEEQTVKWSKVASEVFEVEGVGAFTCSCSNKLENNAGSQTFTPQVLMNIAFQELKSVRDVTDLVWGIESLFGFLIGFRLRPPSITVWTAETYKLDEGGREYSWSGNLKLCSANWNDEKHPDKFEIQSWRNADAPNTDEIISSFLKNRESFMKRIHAINEANLFSKTLDRSFAAIAPALEEYLKGRFTAADELQYQNVRQKFFDYIDACPDEAIKEFSRQHIEEAPKGKKPGFKQLIERAIKELEPTNLSFSTALPREINSQRGTLFHTVPTFKASSVQTLLESTRGATFILLLLTFADLGFDLRKLHLSTHRFGKYRQFLPPNGPAEGQST